MKIGVRLSIGFLLVLGLLGGIVYIATGALAELDGRINQMAFVDVPETQDAYEMLSELREASTLVRNMILVEDPVQLRQERQELADSPDEVHFTRF